MKYANIQIPPSEEDGVTFPKLNNVVTIENCFYYISLMERFLQYKSTLGPDLVKIMLSRAEVRYTRWLRYIQDQYKASQEPEIIPPPLDVAYMWHAHMLSPFRYFEDLARNVQFQSFKADFPLKLLHTNGLMPEPSAKDLQVWKELYGDDEPYNLTADNVSKGDFTMECSFCNKDMICSWPQYTNWRFDPNVSIQCHHCHEETTVYTVSLRNFAVDVERTGCRLAGTLLRRNGSLRLIDYPESRAMDQLVEIGKRLYPTTGLFDPKDSIDDLIEKIEACSKEKDCTFPHLTTRIVGCIRSAYHGNPSPFSIDLIQAVGRQHDFNHKATQVVNWQVPFGIGRGIRQYYKFLTMMRRHRGEILVPTLEIDLAWHTHMLHPQKYREYTLQRVRQYVNHDDNIDPVQLAKFEATTNKLWKKSYKGKNLLNDKDNDQPMDDGGGRSLFNKIKGAVLADDPGDFVYGNLPDGIVIVAPGETDLHLDSSCHDRRNVGALYQIYRESADAQATTYDAVQGTGYGYIGKINCAASNIGTDETNKTINESSAPDKEVYWHKDMRLSSKSIWVVARHTKLTTGSEKTTISPEVASQLGELTSYGGNNKGGCAGGGCAGGGCAGGPGIPFQGYVSGAF
ncbi:hypothetical protein O0I10_010773 [Lichtheimia ornata]|uniref:Uncharacterized protein n=1 Tax=Lichtheimia ornata TaxID=688661 RepID=A0AAD7UUZ2_9FUNG|nr:uncharacterized protein O0I10_010773 [Lichtheimia ornata]KAJ8653623.1 hypothetical protein O0I10_010773 [Lichtheimia ornata]